MALTAAVAAVGAGSGNPGRAIKRSRNAAKGDVAEKDFLEANSVENTVTGRISIRIVCLRENGNAAGSAAKATAIKLYPVLTIPKVLLLATNWRRYFHASGLVKKWLECSGGIANGPRYSG